MNIAVIGSGYVGSVTGAAFASFGHRTVVIDIDPEKVRVLNAGQSPIYEPGLDELIEYTVRSGVLSASTDYKLVRDADVIFIAVGTPSLPDGAVDLAYVDAAASSIAAFLNPDRYTVIINKSTVPVGTTDRVASIIEQASGLAATLNTGQFSVVSNPEFLREGYALEDVYYPDRIVIGCSDSRALTVMRSLYKDMLEQNGYDRMGEYFLFPSHTKSSSPVLFETDPKSSELIKYVSNAFLSVKISYVNEVARLCEKLGANALDVAAGMGLDSRIGPQFLQVSSGWSGSCFPKDTAELLAVGKKYGAELTVVKAAEQSNMRMHEYCVEKIMRRLKSLNGKRIGVLGLTFKPNTDDARHTQASFIIARLVGLGAHVAVHDPKGMDMFRRLHGHLPIQYCHTLEEVAIHADAILLLTHWNEYGMGNASWQTMQQRMRNPYVLDTRNALDPLALFEMGFDYEGLGVHF
ncbi:MAG: UDP-glucose/GDP-mannose dehydrogenase family protein [Paenibacillus sp.]|nr:UDP-glucose/GDP-mannose dehydrogenase family protein [Paenibacillus sp.]